jgi:hypothetical protein
MGSPLHLRIVLPLNEHRVLLSIFAQSGYWTHLRVCNSKKDKSDPVFGNDPMRFGGTVVGEPLVGGLSLGCSIGERGCLFARSMFPLAFPP